MRVAKTLLAAAALLASLSAPAADLMEVWRAAEQNDPEAARALAQEPRVLLLDEATSNLDIHHTLSILGAIRRRVRDAGLCVVAALHDLNQAAMFCDRLFFLKKGRIYRQGAVADNLNKEVIQAVYGVDTEVHEDRFSGCLQVSFRLPETRSHKGEEMLGGEEEMK
jgi:iron complex transport system ATP-binding protein